MTNLALLVAEGLLIGVVVGLPVGACVTAIDRFLLEPRDWRVLVDRHGYVYAGLRTDEVWYGARIVRDRMRREPAMRLARKLRMEHEV